MALGLVQYFLYIPALGSCIQVIFFLSNQYIKPTFESLQRNSSAHSMWRELLPRTDDLTDQCDSESEWKQNKCPAKKLNSLRNSSSEIKNLS